MADSEVKNEVTELHDSPSHGKEKRKLQHWKISFRKGSEGVMHSEIVELNSKGTQTRGRRLNVYQQRMAKLQAEKEREDVRDTKRKRTRDDDIASCDLKVHHRDSSLGSSDGDGNSNISQDSPQRNKSRKKPIELEYDKSVLARRQKQIDFGKNTVGYDRYCRLVPKDKRQRNQPSTPPKHIKYSRRAWDGLVKIWRQKLHSWDPPQNQNTTEDSKDSLSDVNLVAKNEEKADASVKGAEKEMCIEKGE